MFNRISKLIPASVAAVALALLALPSQSEAQIITLKGQCSDAVQCTDPAGCSSAVGTVTDCGCGQTPCKTGRCGTRIGCDTCGAGCELEIKEEKVKKTCFEVEEKTICIPTVQLPSGWCCKPLTARSKTIKVLKTKSYECPTTKYIWKKAEGADCVSATCTDTLSVQPAPAVAPAIQPQVIETEELTIQPTPVLETGK